MKAGDVLLFHRDTDLYNVKRDPQGTFFTALIHLTTKSKWNHAAIAISDVAYAEATAGGVQITLLGTSTDDEIRIISPRYDDQEDRLTAVAWALARTGVRYGYLNAFMCGANTVLVGLGTVIKRTDAIICSELVAEALERAGFDFKKDSALVSPGDLATFFGVTR